MQRYWDGDGAWLAVDAHGQVALFATAGVAPIPTVVLDNYGRSPEELVTKLPVLGGYECQPYPGRLSSFIGFAARGFFAYDWHDIHRTVGFSRSYELIAIPTVPIVLSSLGTELLQLARLVTLETIVFGKALSLPIESLPPCEIG